MHKADRDVVNRIEQSFLKHGFELARGSWGDLDKPNKRCALSALLTSDEAITPFAHEIVASRINRSEAWVGSFVSAFDEWPVANEQVFGPANYEEDFNDRSRGYRAGWYCAQRLAAALSIGSKYAVRPFVAPVGLGIPVASELNLAWFPA